jgi:glycosyltransferase involved in cell wall biosynthesis
METQVQVEVHILSWNEEIVLPYTIQFYRSRLGESVPIIVHDNESSDQTTSVAKAEGCTVKTYKTFGTFSDATNRRIKSNCWKKSKASWIIVVDADEWLDVTPSMLRGYEESGVHLVTTKGYNMVSDQDTTKDLNRVVRGVYHRYENKPVLFFRPAIQEINYSAGAHTASPVPSENVSKVVRNRKKPYLYHMKLFSRDYVLARYTEYRKRLSSLNRRNCWGYHYTHSDVEQEFKDARRKCKIVNPAYPTSLW